MADREALTRESAPNLAAELRADGLTLKEIAARMGVSVRAVRKALDPEGVAQEDRDQNARRSAAKRVWERRDENKPRCEVCRGPCSKARVSACARCLADGRQWARAVALEMRAAGRLNHEIAEVLGMHPQRIAVLLAGRPSAYTSELRREISYA